MVLEITAFMQCITGKEQGVKSWYHILMTLSLGQDVNHSTVHHTDSPSHTSKHPFMEITIVSLCCLQWASKSDYMSIRLCVHCISLSEFYKHSNAKSHWTESQPSWELKRQATLCYAHYRKIGMHSFFFSSSRLSQKWIQCNCRPQNQHPQPIFLFSGIITFGILAQTLEGNSGALLSTEDYQQDTFPMLCSSIYPFSTWIF